MPRQANSWQSVSAHRGSARPGAQREARGAPVTGLLPQGHLDTCGNWAPPLGRIGRCPSEPWTNSDQALCPSEKPQCPPHTHTQAGAPTKSHTPQQTAPGKLYLVSGRRFLTQRTAVRSLHGDPTSSDTETQTQQHWSLLPTHGCLLTPQTTTCLHTRESTQLWAQTYPPPSHNTPAHTCERLCRHRYAHPERRHTHMQPRHTDPQAESKAVRQPRPKHMPPRGVSNLHGSLGSFPGTELPPFWGLSFPTEDPTGPPTWVTMQLCF